MKKSNGFINDWKIKILCFIIACLTFFVVSNSKQSERIVRLPLEVKLPAGYAVESNIPETVDLVIKGTEDRIYMVDISDITLTADFSDVKSEGVATVPVEISVGGSKRILNLSTVSLYTDPSAVKIYFSKR